MSVEVFPAARERLIAIWQYTAETWGDEQADQYVGDLVAHARALASRKPFWRPVKEHGFRGVFCSRFRHHHLFFREFTDGGIGVLSILHESMEPLAQPCRRPWVRTILSSKLAGEPDLRQVLEMGVAGGEFAVQFVGDGADPDVVGGDRRALALQLIEEIAVKLGAAAGEGRHFDLGLAQEVIELRNVLRGASAFSKSVEQLAEDDAWQHDPVGDGDVRVPAAGATPVAVGIGIEHDDQVHSSGSMRWRSWSR